MGRDGLDRRRFLLTGAGAAAGVAGIGTATAKLWGEREGSVSARGAQRAGDRMPTAFIPHGGGPWPILSLPAMPQDETRALARYMGSIAEVPRQEPKALLVVSAHWEESTVTVNTNPSPDMYYDYGGFPKEAYELQWPAPGAPGVAEEVESLLRGAGIQTATNRRRGYDHGTFVPLLLAYPDAGIPVVQVSLRRGLDPAEHLAIGRALEPLRSEGVYIIGSGNSYHNLPKFFSPDARSASASQEFDAWLNDAVVQNEAERTERLQQWARAPSARACHPREEHLIPLMVAAGAAGADAGWVGWQGTMGGMQLSAHYFG